MTRREKDTSKGHERKTNQKKGGTLEGKPILRDTREGCFKGTREKDTRESKEKDTRKGKGNC